MTDREVMKMALEALEALEYAQAIVQRQLTTKSKQEYSLDQSNKAIEALRQALAQPEQDDEAYGYAKRLAEAIWEKHYKEESPHWRPFDNTLGVLTQIDNMTCGLEKAQPKQESISRCKQCGGALPVTGALDRTGECDCIGQLKVISTIAWFNAPIKTEWGEDMMCASVFIDNNHTLTLYCERSQIHKVPNIIKEQA